MTKEAQSQTPPRPSSLELIRTLALISMISGLLVVLVSQYTGPIIKEKERLALEDAVFRIIPGVNRDSATRISFRLDAAGLAKLDEETGADDANVFAVYAQSGELAGIVLQGAAQGYQGIVRTLFGYDPDCQCIVGLLVMQSTDTPGMGDKKAVEGNQEFMANFQALDARLDAGGTDMAHPIETVKHGTKIKPWQVDAISGATITSKAIGKGLRDSTKALLPLVSKHLSEIEASK